MRLILWINACCSILVNPECDGTSTWKVNRPANRRSAHQPLLSHPFLLGQVRYTFGDSRLPAERYLCGQDLGVVALLPPNTPNNVFEEYVSTVYQPSSSSEELKIRVDCAITGQTTRFYVGDVSIEFA
ncbi:hypothetical protein ACKLNR_010873 [Fusarium oxysporum f. sp. zingiberi]